MKYPVTVDPEIAALFAEIESSELYAIEAAKSDIAVLIHGQMEARGVSCAELSRRLGKSRAYVSKMLGGGTNMTIETLVGIARVLDCHFSEFIPRPPQAAKPKVATPRKKDKTQTVGAWRKVSPRSRKTADSKVTS